MPSPEFTGCPKTGLHPRPPPDRQRRLDAMRGKESTGDTPHTRGGRPRPLPPPLPATVESALLQRAPRKTAHQRSTVVHCRVLRHVVRAGIASRDSYRQTDRGTVPGGAVPTPPRYAPVGREGSATDSVTALSTFMLVFLDERNTYLYVSMIPCNFTS